MPNTPLARKLIEKFGEKYAKVVLNVARNKTLFHDTYETKRITNKKEFNSMSFPIDQFEMQEASDQTMDRIMGPTRSEVKQCFNS